jgi:hypothetical protein
MARWVKLTLAPNDGPTFINLDNALSMTDKKSGGTRIGFPGDDKAHVDVKETTAQILEILKKT